jgi:hypothetical protein
MADHHQEDDGSVLSVRLDLDLDRQPISGRLRTEQGGEEGFVGWLGFVDALKRLHDKGCPSQTSTSNPTGEEPQ